MIRELADILMPRECLVCERQLAAHMARQGHFADIDTVLPVPLHWWRKWNRGYNQAEVIAAELAKALSARMALKA